MGDWIAAFVTSTLELVFRFGLFGRMYMKISSLFLKKKWMKEGTWPAKITGKLIQECIYLPNIRCAKVVLKISIIPRIPFHLDRLAVLKEGGISPLRTVVLSGLKGGLMAELPPDEKSFHLGETSQGVIRNEDIDRVYYCDATFYVPCEETEDLHIKAIALVDIKEQSYEVESDWIIAG